MFVPTRTSTVRPCTCNSSCRRPWEPLLKRNLHSLERKLVKLNSTYTQVIWIIPEKFLEIIKSIDTNYLEKQWREKIISVITKISTYIISTVTLSLSKSDCDFLSYKMRLYIRVFVVTKNIINTCKGWSETHFSTLKFYIS